MSYLVSFKNTIPGRTIDAGFLYFDPNQKVSAEQTLTKDGGSAVAGTTKLAQKVLLRLLSATGTYMYEPLEKSLFATDILNGYLNSVSDIRTSLQAAITEISDAFFDDLDRNSDTPADERLSAITIDNIQLSATIADITLTVYSEAGTNVTFTAPVKLA